VLEADWLVRELVLWPARLCIIPASSTSECSEACGHLLAVSSQDDGKENPRSEILMPQALDCRGLSSCYTF
jgi:hypothetical protein